jgi:hypothetical protein
MDNQMIEQPNYRPNACKPVYKFNKAGELVHTYNRTTDAVREEHIMYTKLKALIQSGNILRDHTFSFSLDTKCKLNSDDIHIINQSDQMPWESDNGMFDISGWGKVCL